MINNTTYSELKEEIMMNPHPYVGKQDRDRMEIYLRERSSDSLLNRLITLRGLNCLDKFERAEIQVIKDIFESRPFCGPWRRCIIM